MGLVLLPFPSALRVHGGTDQRKDAAHCQALGAVCGSTPGVEDRGREPVCECPISFFRDVR